MGTTQGAQILSVSRLRIVRFNIEQITDSVSVLMGVWYCQGKVVDDIYDINKAQSIMSR